MEADAIRAATVAGLVEQGVSLGGVVGVLFGIRSPGPVARRQKAFGEAGLAAIESLDEQRTVHGEGDRGADAGVAQDGVAEVKDDVVENGAGAVVDGKVGVATEGVDLVGGEGVAFDVG